MIPKRVIMGTGVKGYKYGEERGRQRRGPDPLNSWLPPKRFGLGKKGYFSSAKNCLLEFIGKKEAFIEGKTFSIWIDNRPLANTIRKSCLKI